MHKFLSGFFVLAIAGCVPTSQQSSDEFGDKSDAADTKDVDGGLPDGLESGAGTWDDPIVIGELPFRFSGDTREAPDSVAQSYAPCAPDTIEGGGEFVFVIDLDEATRLRALVDDVGGDEVDVDVHLLDGAQPDQCLARDNRQLSAQLAPGRYWISVDTWSHPTTGPMSGVFDLEVAASSGAEICSVNPEPNCSDGDAPFVNGIPSESPGIGGCPAGMQPIDGNSFCIDTFEASLAKVEDNGSLSAWSPHLGPGNQRVRALSAEGVVPQGHINQVQAGAACAEAGKRLCTNTEWVRACKGGANRQYPYGDTHQDEACNEDRTCHPVTQFYESTADWVWSAMNNSCLNQLPEGLATTGEYAACRSEEGIMDMMGNLHEWTSDPAGTFRGGFYVDTTINGTGCDYRTTAHNTSHSDYSTGFRCCAD